ncbi:hypothetical protein KBD59_05720, partial [Candidatus Gracilibacteria bacterium]|nr:hypothetical protein [Candidatus Gracilibacteria bacterium]
MFTYNASGEQNTDYKLVDNDVYYKTEKLGTLELQIPGAHNRSNALAAFSVAHHFGITAKDILSSLKHFTGAHRRFEIKGSYENAVIIDDYAHHPVEIKATLQAVREKYPKARVCAVFQPHQFSRTHALLEEFKGAFKDADLVIVPNIYAARDTEEDKAKISAESLVESLNKAGVKTLWGQGIEETLLLLQQKASDFDVIITMGAGDIWKISSELTKG